MAEKDDYDISPLDLDALRREHPLLIERFEADAVRESNAQAQHWFAESERLQAALDRAEAVVAAARRWLEAAEQMDSDFDDVEQPGPDSEDADQRALNASIDGESTARVAVREALRAYEDADKVADG